MLERSETYENIAAELMETDKDLEYLNEASVSFVVLRSDQAKKHNYKATCGECHKIPDKYRWCIPFDFQITIYEPNIESFSDEDIRTLIKHEMLHMGVNQQGNEPKLYVVPHDVEDFDCIIEERGLHWADKGEREKYAGNNEKGDRKGKQSKQPKEP